MTVFQTRANSVYCSHANPGVADGLSLSRKRAGGSKEPKNNPQPLQSYVTYDTLRVAHCCYA
jgi:hypothetical protein